jgi:HlyD family secretion protein
MSVRRTLLLLTLLMFSLPVVAFWAQDSLQADQYLTLQNLQIHTVDYGTVELVVSAIGAIEAHQNVSLSFTSGGRVAEIFVRNGDYVQAGDPLMRLANEAQRLAYVQAALNLERAQLELDDLTAPPDEHDVRIAQANLDSAWGAYMSIQNAVTDDDIQAAELAYQQARETYDTLRAARDQAIGGYDSPAYNTLDAQAGAASFNTEIARLRLESLRTGNQAQLNTAYARVVQAQAELERVQAGPQSFQIEQAELRIRQAETQLQRAEQDYYRTLLTAPFSGVIAVSDIEAGSLVTPGRPVVQLTDLSALHLTVKVDEIDIGKIETGLSARVQLDALPRLEMPASLQSIAQFGESDGGLVSYDVKVSLLDTDLRIRVGMTAEAAIVVDVRQGVVVVPNIFIRRDRDNRAFVDVLRGETLVSDVEITLGLIGQENSEVVAGLQLGDVIALDLAGNRFDFFGG